MSTSTASVFNGPFKRADLLRLPQYTASEHFVTAGKWTGTKNHILSVNSGEDDKVTEPLYCVLVGTISADKVYLSKHGNFTPKFSEEAHKAKLQFTVTRPSDPDFGPDYDKAMIALKDRQSRVAQTSRHLYFLIEDNAIRFNFGLFEPKGENKDWDREKDTIAYTVDRQYSSFWADARINHYSCVMPAFDTNDMPINPNHFAEKLVGAMCEVTFTLKHFSIRTYTKSDGSVVEANDVFSAHVESVAILKHPPVIARSPYKGHLARRLQHRPQLPSRGEQVNAAAAFVPKLGFVTALDTSPAIITARADSPIAYSPMTAESYSPLENLNNDVTTIADTTAANTMSCVLTPEGSTASVATLTSDDGQTIDHISHQPVKKRKYGI